MILEVAVEIRRAEEKVSTDVKDRSYRMTEAMYLRKKAKQLRTGQEQLQRKEAQLRKKEASKEYGENSKRKGGSPQRRGAKDCASHEKWTNRKANLLLHCSKPLIPLHSGRWSGLIKAGCFSLIKRMLFTKLIPLFEIAPPCLYKSSYPYTADFLSELISKIGPVFIALDGIGHAF